MTRLCRNGLILLAVLSSTPGLAQKKLQHPAHQTFAPRQEKEITIDNTGWMPLQASPISLARRSDQFLSRLQRASGTTRYLYENPTGLGYSVGTFAILTQSRFYIEYAKLINVPHKYNILPMKLVGDGRRSQTWRNGSYGPITPVGLSRLSRNPFKEWAAQNPRILWSAVGTHDRPLEAIVSGARSEGFHVKAEQRSFTQMIDNVLRRFRQYRIFIWKPNAKGANAYMSEILIDPSTDAPMTIRVTLGSGKKLTRSLWSCKWDLDKKQVIDMSLFKLPRKLKPVKLK